MLSKYWPVWALLFVCLWVACPGAARAETGLAHVCVDADAATKGTTSTAPQCMTRGWERPKPDGYYLSCLTDPVGVCKWGRVDAVFRRFSDLPAAALLNVCTRDLVPGTFTDNDPCGVGDATKAWVPKSELTAELPVPAGTGWALLQWTKPTTNTDNSPATDLAGYWVYQSTDSKNWTKLVQLPSPDTVQHRITGLLPGTYYWALTAYDIRNTESVLSNGVSKTIQAPDKPTITMTASPSDGVERVTTQLAWSVSNAAACAASGGWSGSRPLSGQEILPEITASTTYTLTCNGPGGSVTHSVRVEVSPRLSAPVLELSPQP